MTTIKRTYCRICEAHCGLTVEVDEERLNYPMKRVGSTFERITRKQAKAELGAKVRELS